MKDYSTNISIRLSILLLDKIDTEAEKLNITRNDLVKDIILKYFERGK